MRILMKLGVAFGLLVGMSTVALSDDDTMNYKGVIETGSYQYIKPYRVAYRAWTKYGGDKYEIDISLNFTTRRVTKLMVKNLDQNHEENVLTSGYVYPGGPSFDPKFRDCRLSQNGCFDSYFEMGGFSYRISGRVPRIEAIYDNEEVTYKYHPTTIYLRKGSRYIASYRRIPAETELIKPSKEGPPEISITAMDSTVNKGTRTVFKIESDFVFQEDTRIYVRVNGQPQFSQFWAKHKTTYVRVLSGIYEPGTEITAELLKFGGDYTVNQAAKTATITVVKRNGEMPESSETSASGSAGEGTDMIGTPDERDFNLEQAVVSARAVSTGVNKGRFEITVSNGNFETVMLRRVVKYVTGGFGRSTISLNKDCDAHNSGEGCFAEQEGSYKAYWNFDANEINYRHRHYKLYESVVVIPSERLRVKYYHRNYGDDYKIDPNNKSAVLVRAGTDLTNLDLTDATKFTFHEVVPVLAPVLADVSAEFNGQYEQSLDFAMSNLGQASFSINGSESISDFIKLGGRMANGEEFGNNYSFSLPVMPSGNLPMTVWGHGFDTGNFTGLGFHPRNDLMVGVSVSTNEYGGDFEDDNFVGLYQANLTALMTHLAWTEDATSMRISAGTGTGSILLDLEGVDSEIADSAMQIASVKGRRVLFSKDTTFGDTELAIDGNLWAVRQVVEDNGSLIRKSDVTNSEIDFTANASYDVSFWNVSLDMSADIGVNDQEVRTGLSYALLHGVTPYLDVEVDSRGLDRLGFGSRVVAENDMEFHLGTVNDGENDWKHTIDGKIRW